MAEDHYYEAAYTITDMPDCQGTIQVKARNINHDNEYAFAGCIEDGELWNCSCKHPIVLKTNEVDNEFDVVVQYYIGEQIESNQRVENFNNIKTGGDEPKKESKPLPKFTSSTGLMVTGIIVVILLVLGGIGYLLFRWLFGDSRNKLDDEKKLKLSKTVAPNRVYETVKKDVTEDDVDEFLKGL